MGAKRGKQHLLLIELLVAILFFTLSAAICSGILVRAYRIGQDSAQLSEATLCATQAAEVFKYAEGDVEVMADLLGGEVTEPHRLTVYYGADWNVSAADEAEMTMTVTTVKEPSGSMRADIVITGDEVVIFKISAKYAQIGGEQ